MRFQESEAIRDLLSDLGAEDLDPIVEIGSANEDKTRHKPWITENVYQPLQEQDVRLIRVDIEDGSGVDVVADILDESGRSTVQELEPKAVFCFNTLEHVEDRHAFADALVSLCPVGGHICVSVPSRYPHHDDPIDNGFRPALDDLSALFEDRCRLVDGKTMDNGRYLGDLLREPRAIIRHASRFPIPFRGLERWAISREFFKHMFVPFQVTLALYQRSE